MLGTVWNLLVGSLQSFVVSCGQKLLAIPCIAFHDRLPAAEMSGFPLGRAERVLEVLA